MSNTVGVVIPAYNAQEFISVTLDSIAAQTRLPDHVVIVDDGSLDSTREIVKLWVAENSNINATLINQENKGASSARNAGILAVETDLIALLDADDRWEPDHLLRLTPLFELHPELVVAFGDQEIHLMREDRVIASCFNTESFRSVKTEPLKEGFFLFSESAYRSLVGGNYIPTSASVMRRDSLIEAGLYDLALKTSEDRDLLLRLSRLGRFGYDEKIHARKMDQHGRNLTDSSNNLRSMTNSYLVLVKQLDNHIQLGLEEKEIQATEASLRTSVASMLYSASRNGLRDLLGASMLVIRKRFSLQIFLPKHWARAFITTWTSTPR